MRKNVQNHGQHYCKLCIQFLQITHKYALITHAIYAGYLLHCWYVNT